MKSRRRKALIILPAILVLLAILGGTAVLILNRRVIRTTSSYILPVDSVLSENYDCILVLGAGVRDDGSPSHMLEDRLKTGIALYESGAAPKLLMSGDHGTVGYDEVNTMKSFAVERGVPSEDVFMDHAGFSTYESMVRAKEIFGCRKILIVTQTYHLYRALYIAHSLGLEADGVSADLRTYGGQEFRDLREVAARVKDVFTSLIRPNPTYLGDAIPISGDGNLTNDKEIYT